MSIRTALVVVLALTFGVSAAVGVNQFNSHGEVVHGPETVPVVVAAVDIPRGGMVSADWVQIRQWPKELAPAGVISRSEDALGRCSLVPLNAGEVVLDIKLAGKHAGRGLAALIPKGMRAFTIQAPHVASGVAGFILPGNKVDVLLTVERNDGPGSGTTATLLQNVEVLAVDQRLDAPSENKVDPRDLHSVTLLVTPEQSAKLDLGQNKGTLHLALRNPDDDVNPTAPRATLADLGFGPEKPEPAQAAAERPIAASPGLQVRTLRGSQNGLAPIEGSNSAARP